jgi:hypothetical protein
MAFSRIHYVSSFIADVMNAGKLSDTIRDVISDPPLTGGSQRTEIFMLSRLH